MNKFTKNRRNIFVILSLIVFGLFIMYFLFNKFIVPPWKSYKGIICDLNGCHTSEIQQQNEYWIDQAIIKKDVALCNNSLGFGFQNKAKEQSVYECKSEYAVGIGDLEYCSSLDKEVQYVNCRQKYAIKYRKPEICEGISTSGDENDRLSIIKACKKEAVK